MARWFLYDNTVGTATARKIISWGEAPNGSESQQSQAANEIVVVSTFEPSGSSENEILYNENTTTFSEQALTLTSAQKIVKNKTIRDFSLNLTDWYQSADVQSRLTYSQKKRLLDFRQSLREVSDQAGWPDTVTWPTSPPDFSPLAPSAPFSLIDEDISSLLTFSRGAGAWYWNSAGYLSLATNNQARIEYDPLTGERLGLLMEPSRTNLLLRSGEFNTTPWVVTRATVSQDTGPTPTAVAWNYSDKLTDNTQANTHHVSQPVTLAASTNYMFKVIAKAAELNHVAMTVVSPGMTQVDVRVNLTTGAVVAGTAFTRITRFGWVEIDVPFTTVTGGASTVYIGTDNGTTNNYAGTGTNGLYLFGADVQAGAFPSSYILTTTATGTRPADACSMTISDRWAQDEATIYVEADYLAGSDKRPGLRFALEVSDGTDANAIRIVNNSSLRLSAQVRTNSVNEVLLNGASPSNTSMTRAAFAVKANSAAHATDGGSAGLDGSVNMPSFLTTLRIGCSLGSDREQGGHIREVLLWKKRLSNAQIEALVR